MQPKLSSLDYANNTKISVQKKADANKLLSNWLFAIIIFGTIFSPILILLPENIAGLWLNKIIPAFLMAGSAICSSWCQLKKPHERWLLYRTAQREIEHEITQYIFSINDYNIDNKDTLLVDKISKRALELHYQWEPMVPKTEDIKNIKSDANL